MILLRHNTDRVVWRKKRSSLSGYDFQYHANYNGYVFKVDYSPGENRARLLVEQPGGKRQWSEIDSGVVVRSNIYQKGRQNPDWLAQNAALFSTIPEAALYPVIGGNHGIASRFPGIALPVKQKDGEPKRERYFIAPGLPPQPRRWMDGLSHWRYPTKARFSDRRVFTLAIRLSKRDWLETALVFAAGAAIWYFDLLDLTTIGASLATAGMTLGAVDMFGRNGDPYLPKVVIPLIAGGYIFYQNYF